MDIRSIISPAIEDRELFEEFADSLTDLAPQIEHDVAALRGMSADRDLTDALFRAVHNLKGDAALCKFTMGVALAHPIESILTRFREGQITFTPLLAETILLAVDRLEIATEALLSGKSIEGLQLSVLIGNLERIAEQAPAMIDVACAEAIESVTGFPPVISDMPNKAAAAPRHAENRCIDSDLQFFRTLALQFESRSPLFKGRTMRILRLAMETNKAGGNKIDPIQLEAAVYLHDFGMMMLPESAWLKVGKMADPDKAIMRNHPGFAAGILQRMPGWEPAAEMVAQHHEMPDGGGYPKALTAEAICPGAKILAIVDAFEAVMLKHIHRGKNRSVLRAIAEINACNNQFAPEWITPFNSVIRKTIEN